MTTHLTSIRVRSAERQGSTDNSYARDRCQARKALSRQLSERLYEVGRVVDAVSRAYHGDRAAIEAFLNRPHPLLEGETPFDMARSNSAGAEAVLNLIRRAEAGVAL